MANTLKFGNGEWYGKKDTILAYNDLNSNYKPLPFNFSRDSKATVINKDGLIETVGSGQPRIDYKDDSKGALLLEPSRSNIVEYSEDGTQWDTINSTVSLTTDSTSPSGQSSVYKVNDDANDAQHRVDVRPSVTSGTQYTLSAFVKKPSGSDIDFAYLLFSSNFSTTRFYFNIEEGTSLDSGGTIENYGNGWYRLSANATANSSGNGIFGVNLTNANNNNIYSGTGNGSMFVWGLQVESNASYPTSYIPTQGSVVTRLADVCNNGGNEQVINSTEGVFYAEVENSSPSTSTRGWVLQSSLNNGSDLISIRFNSSQLINMYLRANSVTTINVNVSNTYNGFIKIALKYKSGENSLWINGVEVHSNSTTFSFSNSLSNLSNYDGLGNYGYFNIKDTKLYNTALTDNELQKLTQV